VIICTKCGNRNDDDDGFCASCGAFLEWSGERTPPSEPPVDSTAETVAPSEPDTPAPVTADATPPEPARQPDAARRPDATSEPAATPSSDSTPASVSTELPAEVQPAAPRPRPFPTLAEPTAVNATTVAGGIATLGNIATTAATNGRWNVTAAPAKRPAVAASTSG